MRLHDNTKTHPGLRLEKNTANLLLLSVCYNVVVFRKWQNCSEWATDNWFQSWIKRSIFFICSHIDALQFKTWFSLLHNTHSSLTRLLHRIIHATGNTSQQRSAKGGSFLCSCSDQLYTKHISKNLSPDRTFCSAAGGAQLFELQTLLLNNCKTIFQAKCNSF